MGSANVRESSFPSQGRVRKAASVWLLLGFLLSLVWADRSFAQTATAPGVRIENTASVTFINAHGAAATASSNTALAIVQPVPSSSSVKILHASTIGGDVQTTAGPTHCVAADGLVSLSAPLLADGTAVDPTQPLTLARTSMLHGGEAMFIELSDADQNRDATLIDTTRLQLTTPSGDRETIQLSETGPASGMFVGYIQTQARAASAGNCVLEVERNSEISSVYVDPYDETDASRASALVDPYGLVFDSETGAPLDGARVRLIDAASGTLAKVIGDDGVSAYPAEMLTGAPVTDDGGTVYRLPAGVFRFPLVTPGRYRLEIDPPAGHAFPSALTAEQLGRTPGGPFKVAGGSFGEEFVVAGLTAVAVDVPADPAPTQLFMQKSTAATVASIGDFVQYSLTIENLATNAAVQSVRTEDYLPLGARYMPRSTRVAGAKAGDPAISPDGRTLTFMTGALAPGARIEVRYVVEITAGARGKQIVNAARAFGPDGLGSNTAQVTIQLREELFRERAIVLGRVVEGDCNRAARELKGVAGVRVYLEDGRYSITDEEGKYHFDDVAPGAHVVQIDTVTIPQTHLALPCAERVRHAGRAFSQFVDVRGGALWRGDFVLQRKAAPLGSVNMKLDTALTSAGTLRHDVHLGAAKLAIENARIMIMLPEGLEYRLGSARLDELHATDPRNDGGVVSFAIGTIAADQTVHLSFETQPGTSASGAFAIKALTTFDTPAQRGQRTEAIENLALRGEMLYESASYRFSPRFDVLDAHLSANDRMQLDRIIEEWRGVSHLSIKAVGHSDDQLIAAQGRIAYADNYALSRARAAAVAEYLAAALDVAPERITIEGRGSDEPLATGHDPESLAMNRRVELSIEGLRIVAAGGMTIRAGSAVAPSVETTGTLETVQPTRITSEPPPAAAPPVELDLDALQPGIEWLVPQAEENPAIPSIKVAIQHRPTQSVQLLVNGAPANALTFDGVLTNANKTVSVSRWRGIDLRDGENALVALVHDEKNVELQRLTRTVRYSGGAVRAEFAREASTLTADGRTHPIIALRMFDPSGQPARPGTQGTYRVEAPYRSWWEVATLDDNKLVTAAAREPTFKVDEDGFARLELEPTTQAGTAVIRLRFNERQEQEMRVWLEPAARDWILVGIAEGTSAHTYITENMQSAADAGLEDGYSRDGRVAFFAKGAIKGEYLLTVAYDSAREHEAEQDHLLGAIEPDRIYTLYGDPTEQRFEAATPRKLF
jgi:uncharacterized repeat protein (TIGR01451 family)